MLPCSTNTDVVPEKYRSAMVRCPRRIPRGQLTARISLGVEAPSSTLRRSRIARGFAHAAPDLIGENAGGSQLIAAR